MDRYLVFYFSCLSRNHLHEARKVLRKHLVHPVQHGFVVGGELGEVHLLEFLRKVARVREVSGRDAELGGDVSEDSVQMLDDLLLLSVLTDHRHLRLEVSDNCAVHLDNEE